MDRKVKPARVLAVLYLAGATLALLSLALPHPPLRLGLMGTIIGASSVIGALIYAHPDRITETGLHVLLAVGTTIVGLAVYATVVTEASTACCSSGSRSLPVSTSPRDGAAAHTAWIVAVYAVALTQVANPVGFSAVTRWVLAAISIAVVAAVTNWTAAERNRADDERQDLLAEVDRLAHTDELTGLPNRRAWDAKLTAALEQAKASAAPLCVAIIDVDNLKEVNDRDGHWAGDELLRSAADGWRAVLRSGDYLARHGGDEFALLLPGCGIQKAEEIIERLRASSSARELVLGRRHDVERQGGRRRAPEAS